jgi:predicted permease
MTIRAALGAGRSRLIRQLITEALVLSILGGVLGLILATWGVSAFVASRPTTIPRIDLLGIDWRVVAFAVAATFITGILVGIAPALRTSRPDVQAAVKDGARSVGRGSTRFRSGLVAAELALATVLLVGAALLAKSFSGLINTDLGFRPEQVVTMRVSLPATAYPNVDSWLTFHRTLIERLAQRPGFDAVGLSSSLPLNAGAGESSMIREGDPPPAPDRPSTISSFHVISAGYFAALGVPIARGRAFDARDSSGTTPVVIIDDRSAERLFPNENPIGRRISFELRGDRPETFDPIWREVVGVVPHVRYYGLATEPAYVELFVPYTQLPVYMTERRPAMALVVRAQGESTSAIAAVRETVRTLDSSIPVYALQALTDYLDQAGEQPRLSATLIGGFALLALALAVIGVYGVLSYAVARRTREIGLRVALGATSGDVMRLVGMQALRLIAIGLILGAAGAIAAGRVVAGLLFGVSPHDPVVFAIVLGVLAVAATVASLLPIRRAARVDPQLALRAD